MRKAEPINKQEFINIQNEMLKQAVFKNVINISEVSLIAGVDLAYWNYGDEEYAVCCIIVLDYKTQEVIEKVEYMGRVNCPYIPGCLAFREIPIFMQANKKLKNNPDVYVFDGNGYLHIRHMGVATHAGILLEKPTIGVAKSYYKINNIEFDMPENLQYSYKDIVVNGEVYGRVLRTQINIKPIFLSVGNMIDLETSNIIINNLITKESHIPIPTRLADIETHKMRISYLKKFNLV